MARITAGTVARPPLPPGRSMVLPRRPASRPASLAAARVGAAARERAERLVPAPIRLDESARLEAGEGAQHAARRSGASPRRARRPSWRHAAAPRRRAAGPRPARRARPPQTAASTHGLIGNRADPDRAAPATPTSPAEPISPRSSSSCGTPDTIRASPGQSRRKPLQPADAGASIEPGHEEALPALLERPRRRDERAAARARLDDDDRVRRAADQPVALREGALRRLDASARTRRSTAPPPSTIGVGEPVVGPREERGVAAADERDRRRAARRRTPRGPPHRSRSRGPDTTVAPARASAVAIRLAMRRPAGLGRRVPDDGDDVVCARAARGCRERTAPAAGSRSRARRDG